MLGRQAGRQAAGAGAGGAVHPSPLLKANNIDSVTSLLPFPIPSARTRVLASRLGCCCCCTCASHLTISLAPSFSGRPRVSSGISARNMIFQPKGLFSADRGNFGSLNLTKNEGLLCRNRLFWPKVFLFFSVFWTFCRNKKIPLSVYHYSVPPSVQTK